MRRWSTRRKMDRANLFGSKHTSLSGKKDILVLKQRVLVGIFPRHHHNHQLNTCPPLSPVKPPTHNLLFTNPPPLFPPPFPQTWENNCMLRSLPPLNPPCGYLLHFLQGPRTLLLIFFFPLELHSLPFFFFFLRSYSTTTSLLGYSGHNIKAEETHHRHSPAPPLQLAS